MQNLRPIFLLVIYDCSCISPGETTACHRVRRVLY